MTIIISNESISPLMVFCSPLEPGAGLLWSTFDFSSVTVIKSSNTVPFLSGVMSTVMSHQPLKQDGEDDDEEEGEEFVFDDSTDEEKPGEESTGVSLDCVTSLQASEKNKETSDVVTNGDKTQLSPQTSPSAGQEDVTAKDVSPVSTVGK